MCGSDVSNGVHVQLCFYMGSVHFCDSSFHYLWVVYNMLYDLFFIHVIFVFIPVTPLFTITPSFRMCESCTVCYSTYFSSFLLPPLCMICESCSIILYNWFFVIFFVLVTSLFMITESCTMCYATYFLFVLSWSHYSSIHDSWVVFSCYTTYFLFVIILVLGLINDMFYLIHDYF